MALIRHEVELEKERLREELGVGGVLHWRSGASGSSSASRSGSSSPLAGVVHPEVEQPLGCEWDEREASQPPSTCESCSSMEEPALGVPPCHYRQVLGEESEPDKTAVLAMKRTSSPDADGYVVFSTVLGFEPGVCVYYVRRCIVVVPLLRCAGLLICPFLCAVSFPAHSSHVTQMYKADFVNSSPQCPTRLTTPPPNRRGRPYPIHRITPTPNKRGRLCPLHRTPPPQGRPSPGHSLSLQQHWRRRSPS